MYTRFLNGVIVGSMSLAFLNGSTLGYDLEQVATDRGNVPLYVPSNADPNASLPLIVSLHGFTGNGTEHENYFNLRSQVDDRQFLLAVPNGTRNGDGDRFWNATDFCCGFGQQSPDDSGYLRGLIETIISDYPVDIESIHVTGHSNGGFMSYRMACDHADLVSSIASLAGATYYQESNCTPSEPVHVLQIHGTNDSVIGYDGACVFFFICYPGALQSVAIWSGYNQCSGATDTKANLDLDGSISGAETTRTVFNDGCAEYGTSELWSIVGGSHGPSFNGNFRRELVDWLLTNRRAAPDTCPADLNGDDLVEGDDLALLLGVWQTDFPEYDINGDGLVNGPDLTIMLDGWGNCQ